MDLLESIKLRRSIRSFKPDPVPKQTLVELLEVATRAPSNLNTQSWELTILGGRILDELKRANLEQASLGVGPHPDVPVIPIVGPSRQRQIELAIQLFSAQGISREDREKRGDWYKKMLRFFDAPNAIIISVDKSTAGGWSIFNIGALSQTIALAAQEYGLGTCIERVVIDYPEVVRRITGIPEAKEIIIGIAIGYPDWNHPVNRVRSKREPLEIVTAWQGVD